MITRLYLDARRLKKDGTAALKLSFTKDGRSVLIPLGVDVPPSQWSERQQRVCAGAGRPDLNAHIDRMKGKYDGEIMRMMEGPDWKDMTALMVRDALLRGDSQEDRLFLARFALFASMKRKDSTREIYELTMKHVRSFDPRADRLRFEDVNVSWLTAFDNSLMAHGMSRNAANIHLRNIRAVFNAAIDDGITTSYPFRRFRIRPMATPKRSLSAEQLRTLFGWPVDSCTARYLDIFKLIFLLQGINMVDLFNLRRITPDGRVEYNRAKTGRFYSVKVEPEAIEIIQKYRGRKRLLSLADRYADCGDYLRRINRALQQIGECEYGKRGSRTLIKPLFPHITTYWARHSWATIAASLDIPKETIAAGLGHGGNTVTDIYIDFDRNKVDEANRRVIDWVFHGKR